MNFIKKDLAPGITVYRPEFKDLNNTLNVVKKSIDSYTHLFNIDPDIEKEYPHPIGWRVKPWTIANEQIMTEVYDENLDYLKTNGFSNEEEVIVTDELNKAYDLCFSDYVKTMQNTDVHLPYIKDYDSKSSEWFSSNFSIHRHKAKSPAFALELWNNEQNGKAIETSIGKNLGWHFDEFQFEDLTYYRHALTANLYINDDYVSGRLMFLYGNTWANFKNFDNLKIIAYKPMAGDIVMYPAFWPVAHSVTVPFLKDRYMMSKIFGYMYHEGDFDLDFMKYCEEFYVSITDGKIAATVPQESIQSVNGKDFWANN